eukprot:958398-Pelagomonas_calceolata.AAC.2
MHDCSACAMVHTVPLVYPCNTHQKWLLLPCVTAELALPTTFFLTSLPILLISFQRVDWSAGPGGPKGYGAAVPRKFVLTGGIRNKQEKGGLLDPSRTRAVLLVSLAVST